MNNINNIFTADIVQFYKDSKHEITPELLDSLRSHGNKGKEIALQILDFEKDAEGYYRDANNRQISYNGILTLKRAYTKLNLTSAHEQEIIKCSQDVMYFMKNYCKIVTKSGTNFPELRPYQEDYLNKMVNEEAIASSQSRQSGKSVVAGIYLLWLSIFKKDILIGIAANKASSAREILDKIKKIYMGLPIWFMPGLTAFNKTYVEFDNGVKILTDSTNGDSFRGYTVNCLYLDEVAWVKPGQWEDFSDAVFPAQGALSWKKTILTSTMRGMNHWYHIVKKAKKGEEYTFHEAIWSDVPRFDKTGELIHPDKFREITIAKHGLLYWNQNYLNEAVGSSATLISSDKLKSLEPKPVELVIDGKLNVYVKPIKGHQYIMSVDPSKDGKDAFSVQITDITNFNFEQAASAKLQIDYLLMPEFLNEWCKYYYNPYLIIENNEGAGQSIADQMYQTYEYENLHFDKVPGSNKKKKYPGTRTTSKSRKQILQTMKTFIENDKLKINDADTIQEFSTFILTRNKYQADEGTHDDMVMSLALLFTIFNDSKNFDDMKQLTTLLFQEISEENVDISEILTIGSFDDGVEFNEEFNKKSYSDYVSYEEFIHDADGFI